MDKNRFKAKPVLDFTDKKITVIDVIQKLKEINNDIKETSTEIESFEKLFKDNTRFRYNTQIETKSEYLNDIFVQISGANSNDVLKIAKYELSRIKANQRKEQEIKDEKKEKFNKELKDQIDKCKEKFEKRKQTNNAGPTFEKFFFTTNGEIVYVDCITEYLYMVITFQGIIEIWEIYNKDDELFTSLKYIENINCSGITNACKLNSIDVTDYKTVNEDFRNANKSSNGKNFKIQQVNQLNAKNIENETIKINSILTYKNSIIYNIVALTKNIDSNAIGKYNTVGLKVINEIYMLLAQYKFYKELQEEKRKKNELKLIDSYKLNVSENTINKYGSAFSVNYSDVMNTMPKIKESTTESISSFNEMKNNKNNNATEDGIILNKIIVRMKTNYFLGNINGIGIIMNIIISENIITGEYIISHHIGNQLQLSTQSILVSEYNYRDNILFMPIYNELKEPYIMAWSIPSFNVEWLCKLSILSDIENQNIIQNVASDDMIIEEKLKQFVKTKNSTQILDYQDVTAIAFDIETLSYIIGLKKGLIIELKWCEKNNNLSSKNLDNSSLNNNIDDKSILEINNSEYNSNNIKIDSSNLSDKNIDNSEKLSKKSLTATLLIQLKPCISDVLIDKIEEYINDEDINNSKYMKSQTEIENILIIPLSLKISRPKISEAKQIIVGCSDGSLRIFNLSTINNKYIEIFHYEIGQENINNNKTASYNSHLGITFTDREYKAKLMKWKSIKEVYRSNIVGLSVNINDFVLAIGYTNDDNLYFFNPHELYPLRNVNILMNRNASKEITEYVKNLPQYTEYIKKNKINTKITTLLNTKCNVTDFIQRHIYFFNNTSKFVICNSNEWCIFSCNDLIDKYKNIYNYISINT